MLNVLVVDDTCLSRVAIRSYLQSEGIRILEASNGSKVLTNTFSSEYTMKDMDLVLVDIYMEGINGFDILQELCSKYPYIPFIAISSNSNKETIMKAIKLGAKDFLAKPFTKEVLLKKLEGVGIQIPQTDELDLNLDEDFVLVEK